MILVPMDTPGVTIVRHCRCSATTTRRTAMPRSTFENVRVPARTSCSAKAAASRSRRAASGPGRIHHCMRCIGLAERALETMCKRAKSRVAFGKPLAEQGVTRERIAESRMEIDRRAC
jgi:acyl-CoA dehydrogenase